MDKLAKLMQDIGILWEKYRMMYLNGMLNTLGLALAATAIGCVIGLLCGILNTIPCAKNDPLPKRILSETSPRHHPHLRRGFPRHADDAAGRVHFLRACRISPTTRCVSITSGPRPS